MLVIISDLHFEEEKSDIIKSDQQNQSIAYSRNLPSKVFRSFISHLADEANRNGAKRLDLVFAGDIFDLHRTSLWFQNNPDGLRPYVSNDQVDEGLEALILKILAEIGHEEEVQKTFNTFRLLAKGKYWHQGERDFPVPVFLYYLPGNHDRLVNATPAIRSIVRELFGIDSSDEPFPHILLFPEEGVMVRHGHEYDRYNYSIDVSEKDTIPMLLPEEAYNQPVFGDFATIDIAARFPYLFRLYHGDNKILRDDILRSIYIRLLEFDDLRPQRAMLSFLLSIPGRRTDPIRVWHAIEPMVYQLMEDLHDDPMLKLWLERMDKKWSIDTIDVVQTTLALKSWRITGLPLGLARFVSNAILEGRINSLPVAALAAREQAIRTSEFQFLVAGHTHVPTIELIANDTQGERYYVDTGTWRNRVPATPAFDAFGRLKTLTYVVFYGKEEDQGVGSRFSGKVSSMDYWSGFTQRWYIRS